MYKRQPYQKGKLLLKTAIIKGRKLKHKHTSVQWGKVGAKR